MNVRVRGPQYRVRIFPLEGSVPEDLLRASIRHIRTSRQMGAAAGSFQISLLPRAQDPGWATRVQPMSYVEISMWVPPRPPTVVMRGFVDTVAETFSIEGGTPSRTIVIAGRDYGKIPLNTKLFYLDLDRKKIPQELELFKQWQIGFDALGSGDRYRARTAAAKRTDSTEQSPALNATGTTTSISMTKVAPPERVAVKYLWTAPEIMGVIFTTFLEPQFNLIVSKFFNEKPALPAMSSLQDDLDEAMKTYAPQYMLRSTWQPYTDVWSLFRTYQNAPWRELFWEESPIAPILYNRPTPWLDEGGSFISSTGSVVERVQVFGDDVISWSLARTDEEARNFFFTYPGIFGSFVAPVKLIGTDYEGMMKKSSGRIFKDNPVLTTTADVPSLRFSGDYQLFGLRMAEYPSQYFDYDSTLKKDDVKAAWVRLREVGAAATKRLVRAFGHGALLENGSMTLKGNEAIRLGSYVEVQSRPSNFVAYVERVQHDFTQGSSTEGRYITTVGVTRGRRHVPQSTQTIMDLKTRTLDITVGFP